MHLDSGLHKDIKEQMEHHHVAGVSLALIDKGYASYIDAWGVLETGTEQRVESASIFNACSISKWVTAMLVMQLVEQGILNLDEEVNRKLMSWKVPEHGYTQQVTLRNLLCHQSGIVDPAGSFQELDPVVGIPIMQEVLSGITVYCCEPIRVTYEPGSDFQYSDAGYCIIQQLIEDTCRQSFGQVMQELIFEPLQMNHSGYDPTPSGAGRLSFSSGHGRDGKVLNDKYPIYPYPASSGLWTTPTDLAVLLTEFMNALKGQSQWNISAASANEWITGQGDKSWAGLGVFLEGSGEQTEISSLGWGAGFQCMMVAYPYLEKGAVIMTNTDTGVHQMKGIIGDIYRAIT